MTYSGHNYLDKVFDQIKSAGFEWGWLASSTWKEKVNIVHARQVKSRSKPIVVFSKGSWKKRRYWHDTFRDCPLEKTHHPWEQSLEEAERLISYFSDPGDLVVDPCGGSFTNAVACKRLGRRFLGCDLHASCVATGLDRLAKEGDLNAVLTPTNLAEVTLPRKSVRLAVIRHEALVHWHQQDEAGEFFWEFKHFLEDSLHPAGMLAIQVNHDNLARVFDDFFGWKNCGTISLTSNRDWKPVVLFSKIQIEIDQALKTSFGEVEDEMSLLARFTEEGDTVVNIGSDTLTAACRYMDRHCVGWALDSEIEERHLADTDVEMPWVAPFVFSNPNLDVG